MAFVPIVPKIIPVIMTIIISLRLTSTIFIYLNSVNILVIPTTKRLNFLDLYVSCLSIKISIKTNICPAPLANIPLIIPAKKLPKYIIQIVCVILEVLIFIIYFLIIFVIFL